MNPRKKASKKAISPTYMEEEGDASVPSEELEFEAILGYFTLCGLWVC